MNVVRLLPVLLVVGLLLAPGIAAAETAEQAAAQGKTLLAKGDFKAALAAYATAAKTDPANRDYARQHAVLRRVIQLREQLDADPESSRWAYYARGLRAFYISQGIYSEALALDKRIFARLKDAPSAAQLAETQLAMDLAGEAAETISALPADQATPVTQALLGIALARQDKMPQARKVAAGIEFPEEVGPRMIYTVARLQARIGDAEAATKLLARCLESTPPSLLEGYRAHAKECPDFEAIAATDSCAQALETKSAIAESKCSGGSGCSGCPMRGKCAHGESEAQ